MLNDQEFAVKISYVCPASETSEQIDVDMRNFKIEIHPGKGYIHIAASAMSKCSCGHVHGFCLATKAISHDAMSKITTEAYFMRTL